LPLFVVIIMPRSSFLLLATKTIAVLVVIVGATASFQPSHPLRPLVYRKKSIPWRFFQKNDIMSSTTSKTPFDEENGVAFSSVVPRGGGVLPLHATILMSQANAGSTDSSPRFRVPWRELFAEALGTFLIVQLGTGAVMSSVFTSNLQGLFQIASVWIIAVTVAIVVTAPISGAHLNPAISFSLALFRKFDWRKVLPYTAAQLVGATAGSAVNYFLYATVIRKYEAAQGLVRATSIESARAFGEYFSFPVTVAQAFGVEAFGTAVLAAVIFAVTHPRQEKNTSNSAPLLIGLTVGALIGVLAPLTQGGFNPARDFGPRLVAYAAGWNQLAFRHCWVYILAPLVGAPLGAALVDKVLYATDEKNSNGAINGDAVN
jgi:glycerol uptake facilitator protein